MSIGAHLWMVIYVNLPSSEAQGALWKESKSWRMGQVLQNAVF